MLPLLLSVRLNPAVQQWALQSDGPLLEGENNLPLGVQLIGNKYDDHRFLGVAKWLEKECQE